MGDRFDGISFGVDSSIVALAILTASFLGSLIATNGRILEEAVLPGLCASACGALIFVPGIAIRNCSFLKGNRYLAALAWRFPVSLAVISLGYCWTGLSRNCFIAALLTCYFTALPLESWLEIRQCQRTTTFRS